MRRTLSLSFFIGVLFCSCAEDALDMSKRYWISDLQARRLLSVDRDSRDLGVQGYFDREISSLSFNTDGRLIGLDPVDKRLFDINPVNAILQDELDLSECSQPHSICYTQSDRLFVIDSDQRLLRLSPLDGRILEEWPLEPGGHYQALMMLPLAVTAPNGQLALRGDLLIYDALPAAGRLLWVKFEEGYAHLVPLVQTRLFSGIASSLLEGEIYAIDEDAMLWRLNPQSGECAFIDEIEGLPNLTFAIVVD
jgi:hypothetical protein